MHQLHLQTSQQQLVHGGYCVEIVENACIFHQMTYFGLEVRIPETSKDAQTPELRIYLVMKMSLVNISFDFED